MNSLCKRLPNSKLDRSSSLPHRVNAVLTSNCHKAAGYVLVQELFQQSQTVPLSNSADAARSLVETEIKAQLSKLPKPDVTQMLPFKPKIFVGKCSYCHIFNVFATFVCRWSLIWINITSY